MSSDSPAHEILPMANKVRNESNSDLEFYSAWFCPYAQRAWITLHYFEVPYHYNEIQLFQKTDKDSDVMKYKIPIEQKPKDFIQVSPLGLVPALNHEKGKGIHESSLCMEYLQDVYAPGTKKSLLPFNPHERFLVRKAMKLIDDKIISHFYTVLLCTNDEEQEKGKINFIAGLEEFGTFMLQNSSPNKSRKTASDGACQVKAKTVGFCFGDDLTMADVMLAPWFYRIENVLKGYRGIAIPSKTNAAMERVHSWWESVGNHSAVKSTFVNKDRLFDIYVGYANNSAT